MNSLFVSGEGQVYTIGDIGKHKVVSTKLSRNGYEQGAVTSAGNTVTRMLGENPYIVPIISKILRLGDLQGS